MCNRLLVVTMDGKGNARIVNNELMMDAPAATRRTVEVLKGLTDEGVAAVVVETDFKGYFLGLRADLAVIAAKPDPLTEAVQGILEVLKARLPAATPIPTPVPEPTPDVPPAA